MQRQTFHLDGRYFVVDIEERELNVWSAATIYKRQRLEARSNTEQSALAALLAAIQSEIAAES